MNINIKYKYFFNSKSVSLQISLNIIFLRNHILFFWWIYQQLWKDSTLLLISLIYFHKQLLLLTFFAKICLKPLSLINERICMNNIMFVDMLTDHLSINSLITIITIIKLLADNMFVILFMVFLDFREIQITVYSS